MGNYKEIFEYKNGIGILKYKKYWWSKWEWKYCFDFETQGL